MPGAVEGLPLSPAGPQVDLSQFASLEDAIEKAQASFAGFVPLAKRIIAVDRGGLQLPAIFMLSALARATGLCLGVVDAVKAENPHVAFLCFARIPTSSWSCSTFGFAPRT